jgi:hypothetical protein
LLLVFAQKGSGFLFIFSFQFLTIRMELRGVVNFPVPEQIAVVPVFEDLSFAFQTVELEHTVHLGLRETEILVVTVTEY